MTPELMLSELKEFYSKRSKNARNSKFITDFLNSFDLNQATDQELNKLKGLHKRLRVHRKERAQKRK